MAVDPAAVAIGTTIVACFASGFLPFVTVELYVVALGSLAPRPLLPVLLVLAALCHMLGKAVVYFAGRGLERLPPGRFRARIAAAQARLDRRAKVGDALVFVSAAAGLPPFYVVTAACGVIGYDFRRFFLLGFVGRLLRFATLLYLPHLARTLMP
jgi:membrane protein YqaA with SNARE-associated domain